MAQMGRPKKEKTKSHFIGIRLTDDCYARLQKYAAERKLTITQVVQEALERVLK